MTSLIVISSLGNELDKKLNLNKLENDKDLVEIGLVFKIH